MRQLESEEINNKKMKLIILLVTELNTCKTALKKLNEMMYIMEILLIY